MPEDKLSQKIMWAGFVVDNDDPLMLNRVRINFDTLVDGQSTQSILEAIPDSINGEDTKNSDRTDLLDSWKWTYIDSFCFLPLLPLFIKVTPKIGEAVNVIFPNPMFKKNEQYYIQGSFTSPKTMFKQNFEAPRMFATKDTRTKDVGNLKNPETLEYYNELTNGVFPEPNDSALLGRGTCDIIVKENHVLLRAGKSTTKPDSENKDIFVNPKRSFIQLSDFPTKLVDNGVKEFFRAEIDSTFLKYLIEWNLQDANKKSDNFNLEIYVYKLTQNYIQPTTTENFNLNFTVQPNNKSLFIKKTWLNLSLSAGTISNVINTFIALFDDINTPIFDDKNLSEVRDILNNSSDKNTHPFYFRPDERLRKDLTSPDMTRVNAFNNVNFLMDKVYYKSERGGFGLVSSKGRTGKQGFIVTEKLKLLNYEPQPVTYNILGGDRIYFLSHDSRIPKAEQINLDSTTVKEITQEFLIDKVLPNTNSAVRGEELLELLRLIVTFLVGHGHSIWQIPPITKVGDVTVDKLTAALANAENTILNKNIRIN